MWSLICSVVFRVNPFKIGLREYISRFICTSIQNVYWFFIPLFAIYLAMPVLSLLRKNRNALWYMAGITFVTVSFLPPVFSYLGIAWNGGFNFVMAGGYLLFTILGYLLSTEELSLKRRIVIYILGILGVVIRYGGTVILSLRDGAINKTFFNYLEYYSVFLAVAVFVWFRHSHVVERIANHQKATKIIATVSGCSFGIYLIHMIVNKALTYIMPDGGWIWRLLVPFLIYGISLLIIFIMKRIPVIKHIVP